jgi:hypothetical protein
MPLSIMLKVVCYMLNSLYYHTHHVFNLSAIVKYIEVDHPHPSRNSYLAIFATSPQLFPLDSNNSPGNYHTMDGGPITGYGKVVGCSLTTEKYHSWY